MIPGGILLAGAFWIRESPRWLIVQGRREEAIRSLSFLRKLDAQDQYMIEEIYAMDQAHQEQVATIGTRFFAPFKALFSSRPLMKRMALGKTNSFSFTSSVTNHSSRRLFVCVAERFWNQRHQLLFPNCLQVYWCHRHFGRFILHWYLRCHQDYRDCRLAFITRR